MLADIDITKASEFYSATRDKIAAELGFEDLSPVLMEKVAPGAYLVAFSHFLPSHFDFKEWDGYQDFSDPEPYGVVDSPEQFLEMFGEVLSKEKAEFMVCFTPIWKEHEQGRNWRWHKWGTYYGTQHSTEEYLYDEPEIELIYIYSIWRKENSDG